MKLIRVTCAALALGLFAAIVPALGDGIKDCTTEPKDKWKPQAEAEEAAKKAGYEVRRSKIEGTCYEVYAVREGVLFELFYDPATLQLKHTVRKG